MEDNERNKIYLKIEYLPKRYQKQYNMTFNQHITIIGNIKGLYYLIETVKNFLNDIDNRAEYDFTFGKELSDDSLGFRIVLIETTESGNEDDFKLKLTYSLNDEDKPLNLYQKPYVTLIGDKSGLEYFAEDIEDFLNSGVCIFDNLNFDIGPNLDDDSIAMDVVCI